MRSLSVYSHIGSSNAAHRAVNGPLRVVLAVDHVKAMAASSCQFEQDRLRAWQKDGAADHQDPARQPLLNKLPDDAKDAHPQMLPARAGPNRSQTKRCSGSAAHRLGQGFRFRAPGRARFLEGGRGQDESGAGSGVWV